MSRSKPGQALFKFVRHWSRRSMMEEHSAAQGRLVLVTEAIHSLSQQEIAATVNSVAHEIGIDQSGASRLVKSAIAAGFLAMRTSETDGRQRQANVTPAGHSMLKQAHDWQERIFDQLAEGWSEQRRRDFHRAMTDLIDRSYTMEAPRREH
jgi:DNA-binding MarR family transcriptional regulator